MTMTDPEETMQSRKIVLTETRVIAIGELLCIGAMFGIYALLGLFDKAVLIGGLFGGILAVGNFFFMAVGASLAADKAEKQDVKGGKSLLQMSQLLRYLVLAVCLFAGAKSGLCDLIALALPLVFVRPILTFGEFFRKSGD